MDKILKDIKELVDAFNQSIIQQLPQLEERVNEIIKLKNDNCQDIEHTLDTLLSLTIHGFGDELFIKLLEYYKIIDAKGAEFYWNAYDEEKG